MKRLALAALPLLVLAFEGPAKASTLAADRAGGASEAPPVRGDASASPQPVAGRSPAPPPLAPVRPHPAGPALAAASTASVPSTQTPTSLAVAEAAFGTGVEQRALLGQAEAFQAGGRVYCLTRLTGGPGQSVVHAWFHDGQKVNEVKLAVDYPTTTTWSYKTVGASEKGAWRVDVLGADGAVLKTAGFTVQ